MRHPRGNSRLIDFGNFWTILCRKIRGDTEQAIFELADNFIDTKTETKFSAQKALGGRAKGTEKCCWRAICVLVFSNKNFYDDF